jgi:hypothetical protein
MKKVFLFLFCAALPTLTVTTAQAAEIEVFEGKKRYACEALMCLTANKGRPEECQESINKYFAIHGDDPKETIEERRNFLRACPTEGQDELINALAEGAGNCDMEVLTRKLNNWIVRSKVGTEEGSSMRRTEYLPSLPSQCTIYQTVLNDGYGQDVVMPEQEKFCFTVPDDESTTRVCAEFWVDPEDHATACGAIRQYTSFTAKNITDSDGNAVCRI